MVQPATKESIQTLEVVGFVLGKGVVTEVSYRVIPRAKGRTLVCS